MGLKVWFPFLGDLNQQGCSDVKATNLGAVASNNNGKIGKCMSFNGSATGALRLPPVLKATDDFSICFWVKFNNLSVNHCLFSQRTAINDLGFTIFWVQGQTGIRLDAGGAISGGYTRITSTTEWYHVVCCRDKSYKRIYINGELIREAAYTTTQASNVNANYSFIGGSQSDAAGSTIQTNVNILNGYLNDYRIYDHCLSAAEVREISQGLVLHYKLDASGGSFANPNLLIGNVNDVNLWTANQCTKTQDGNAIKAVINSTTGDRRIYLGTTNVWTPVNSTFTVSFDAKAATNNLSIRASRSNITGTDSVSFTLTTEWKHYSGIIINSAEATGGTLSIQCTVNGGTFWVRNVKLERGNIETRFLLSTENANIISDSSGYNHNGTITGTLTLSSDTPRYLSATTSSVASNILNTDSTIPTALTTNNKYTMCLWLKTSATTNRWIYAIGDGSGTRRGLWTTTNGSKPHFAYSGSGAFTGTATINDNKWHHIAFTVDGATSKCFVDGVECGGSTSTKTDVVGSNKVEIVFNGSDIISDFRLYATTLDADAIRQLYEVSTKVDNKQNLHTFELVENNSKIQITKQGQVKCNELEEDEKTKFYQADQIIETNEIIEL